ncbi:hypothetical protein [Salinarimonas ramus]|uniref:Uncharacterized protein n=1 Tax=Salinarimonas ramus TaxID=690164 RepID=A0A917Q5P4_9HYPH|nr:hypothetical protein [Salinarimonas ramus]GGK27097.1 hypothetical protein GCM10011322_11990 [Salinarimonas ramus]
MSPEIRPPGPLLADTITRLPEGAAGAVVVTGSHGGVYAAYVARRDGVRAVILNDAGVGKDDAGIGGLAWLDAAGMAAATVAAASADIGDAADMVARGIVSHANARAAALGVRPGQACAEAAALLEAAAMPEAPFAPLDETRRVETPPGARRPLVLVDSAALVKADADRGAVVVTGSHGALFGGDPRNALKADAALALFNDAGGGIGTTRLPALETRGIAAATVAASSARIGDARSTLEDGIVSALNARAAALGGRVGMRARDLVGLALHA